MNNTYSYGSHKDLEPTELFLFIAVEQTCEQLGIDDVEYVILIFSGLPILPTRQAIRSNEGHVYRLRYVSFAVPLRAKKEGLADLHAEQHKAASLDFDSQAQHVCRSNAAGRRVGSLGKRCCPDRVSHRHSIQPHRFARG